MSAGVVRVGDTVRKPVTAATDAVLGFLTHLEEVGYAGAPRPLGRDEQGRMVIEYVAGPVAHTQPLLDLDGLRRVGRLIRALHDASATYAPPAGAVWAVAIAPDRVELVCHHDLAPWNLVLGEDRWVFIDWDGAGPGSRLWDLAYAAHGFVAMAPGNDVRTDGVRLAALVVGYDLSRPDRLALVDLLVPRIRSMFDLLVRGHRDGLEPWSRLWAEGHGDHWGPTADWVAANLDVLRRSMGLTGGR